MKNEMKRGLALLLCLAMVVGVFVGVPGLTTVANAAASSTVLIGDGGNGTFEAAIDTKWTPSNANYVQIVAGAGRDGSAALYINDTGSAGYNAKNTQLFEVQPGTSISATVYTKGTHTAAQLYFWWYTEDGTTAASTQNAGQTWEVSSESEWTATTVTKTAPSDAKYATISLNTGAAATGEVYFDDLSVHGAKVNTANTNLLGYAAPGQFNTTGIVTTYDEGTDTATITVTSQGSGAFAAGSYDKLSNNGSSSFPANATYVVEFDLQVSSYSSESTALAWLRVQDATNSNTAYLAEYVKVTGSTTFEFTTTAASSNLQLYVRPRINGQNATFSISNLTVYAKCGQVVNGSFDDAVIPGWTLTENDGTSMAISEGRSDAQGLALIDNSTTAFASVTSDYIPVDANYARQRPVGYMGAKGTGLTGVSYVYHYYDENKVELKPTSETWSGASKTLAWRAATGSRTDISESWGTKALSTANSYMYIPYGTRYLTIEIRTGTAVGDTGTLYIDNFYVNLYCEHINGTHEDPTATAESTVLEHAYKAPTFEEEGNIAYHECSVCGVKYTDATAATVLSTDVTLPVGKVLRNIDQGNSLDMIFALKGTDLTNMNIDPANVTADISFLQKSLTGLAVEEYTDATYGTLWRVEFPNISAKEMFDVMTVKFYNGEEEIYSGTQNIRSYANDCIKDETISDQWKNACIDLLHYGAAAQTYFNHRTNQLANSGVAASETVFTQDKVRTVSVGEEDFIASAIRFQSNLKMTFAVAASTGATSGTISFTNHKGVTVERTVEAVAAGVNGQSALCFEFDGMVVADIDCDITFTAYNGETVVVQAVDSMDAYIGRVAETSAMYELAQAFGKYSTSAYTYLHS